MIGLMDVDGKLPVLSLMRISTYFKGMGEQVEFVQPGRKYEKVFASCLFTFNKKECDKILQVYPDAEIGGTGWSIDLKLPEEIQSCKPDYDLYTPEVVYTRLTGGISNKEKKMEKAAVIANMGIGFTSTGCIRNCSFCFVPKKEGTLKQASEIKDIINPRSNYISLLDNNFTADPLCVDKLKEIKERNLIVNISQGIDVRVLTDDVANALSEVKLFSNIYYAWDLIGFENSVLQGIKLLSKFIKPYKHRCYMLVGYDTSFEEDMYRVRILDELGVKPYIMIYNNQGDKRLHHFQRWVNGFFYKVVPWDEYAPWVKYNSQYSLC
jgi:hypothetical protein